MGKQKYYIKATKDNGQSGYDPDFHYHEGENVHPNPDLSNEVCGRGIHLGRAIGDASKYVSGATEFYLATPNKILGKDDTKIRTDKVTLWRIPNVIVDEYWAKRKAIDDEYKAKCKPIYDEYWAKCKAIDDEYKAKRKAIYDESEAKCKAIEKWFMRTAIRSCIGR